jgi:hypothetical protein
MADRRPAGTGTMMRPDALRRCALAAGYRDVAVPPIENCFYTLCRLVG